MGGRSNATATSQHVPNIVHSHEYLNERVITNSIIALQDSRRITIIVVTLASRTYCTLRTLVPSYVQIRHLIERSLLTTSGRDMAVTWP